MLRRKPSAGNLESQLFAALFSWSDEFEAGLINDPALVDGTLEPGERVALRLGPVVHVTLAMSPTPEIASIGRGGTLLATDRRALVLADDGGSPEEWWWATDVLGVTPLPGGIGVSMAPSQSRHDAGHTRMEALVVPQFVEGVPLDPATAKSLMFEFLKVRVASVARQPGAVAAWRTDFRRQYGV
jgi:hypothetical protein